MFSLMTALLSPKVMETMESRKDMLFQALTERAGVLCVQPSSGICLLQGEWECMKKAHLVLEELCLQVQAQDRVQALMQARQKAYHDIQANYQRMAEEAIKGLTRESPNSQASPESHHGESPPRLQPHNGQDDEEMPQEKAVTPQQPHMAATQHPSSLDPPSLDSVNCEEVAPQVPVQELPMLNSTNMNGSKSDEESLNNNNKENMEDSSAVTGKNTEELSGASIVDGADHEEDRDSDGGLRIAMSEDEEEDDDDDGASSLPHDDIAQNLTMRGGARTSDASEGNGPSPFSPTSYSPGQAGDLARSRPYEAFITQASEMKPDVSQLRAMAAQYYAMQQSVFNYSYLTAEARKFLETRMGGNMREPDLRLMSQGLPFPGQPPVAPPVRQDPQTKDSVSQGPGSQGNFNMGPTDLSMVPRRQENSLSDDKPEKKEWAEDGHFQSKFLPEENGEHAAEQNDRPRYLQQRQEWPTEKGVYGSMVLGGSVHAGLVGGQTGDYQCPACMGSFPTRDAVQEHMLQTHAVGPGLQGDRSKPPLSPQINSSFNSTSMADAYCCPICGKFYKSGQRLREHILLHDKNYQRPQYPCPVCGKTFTYRHNMKVHFQKIHKGKQPIKRHECTVCGQKFHKPVYLRHHLLRHKEALYGGLSYKSAELSPPSQLSHRDSLMGDAMSITNHNQATTSCS